MKTIVIYCPRCGYKVGTFQASSPSSGFHGACAYCNRKIEALYASTLESLRVVAWKPNDDDDE